MRAIFSRDKSHLMRSNIFSKTLGESKQSFWDRFTWCGGLIRSDRVIGSPPCEPLWVSLSTFRLATAGKTRLESTRSKKCEASAQNVGCTQKCVMPPSQGCHKYKYKYKMLVAPKSVWCRPGNVWCHLVTSQGFNSPKMVLDGITMHWNDAGCPRFCKRCACHLFS